MNQIYQVTNWYKEACMIAGYSAFTVLVVVVLVLAAAWLIRHF